MGPIGHGRRRGARALPLLCFLCASALKAFALEPAEDRLMATLDGGTVAIGAVQLRIRYAETKGGLVFETESPLELETGARIETLPPGQWRIDAVQAQPARQRFHVFPKTFRMDESAAMSEYMAGWRARGYDPRAMVFGKRFRAGAKTADNRIQWVSLARFDAEAAANALKKQLEGESVWAWVRPETVAPGTATLVVRDAQQHAVFEGPAPLTLQCGGALYFSDVNTGFWKRTAKDRAFAAPVRIEIGPGGALEAIGALPLEEYLRGVVAAEMPPSWPVETLKTQAVAARSEVLANLAGKHALEGFDFCALEHCRAYAGLGGLASNPDAAVAATRGEVLVREGRIVEALFSANCGGYTEANDTVWSGPPNAALRAVFDAAKAGPAGGLDAARVRGFILEPPAAWCARDEANFRWRREFTDAQLAAAVSKAEPVGAVKGVELGGRGPGGRLEWVRVTGTQGTATFKKDLPIRRAFGGLPSTLCIMDTVKAADGSRRFVFRGAGRGHGVGLCQHGARGMTAGGADYRAALLHYFTGVAIERLE